MPVRRRQPREVAQQIVPLLLLGVGLVVTNPSVTIIDDESLFLDAATQPLRQTLAHYLSGTGVQPHPPLFDILTHFWLRWTGGDFNYLRLPSILFFLAGLFLLGRACRHLAGPLGSVAVIWVGVLWPFGFHFGRLAVWYSFSFFLVSGLTLAYLNYLEKRTPARRIVLCLFALGLVWTTYFGWALLACLVLDLAIWHRDDAAVEKAKDAAAMVGLLALSYIPLFRSLRGTLQSATDFHTPPVTVIANAAFNAFSLFTSESIAPWYWRFSVPAGLAILICTAIAIRWAPSSARRFLFFGAFLIASMALLGILNTKRLLTVAPWILLPIGAAIESAKPRWANYGLAIGLLAIGALGWYGVYSRRYYSAPRFIEPWEEIAGEAAGKISNGATVIADHPSFLFYLTYILRAPAERGPWKFEGVLPETVKNPQVFLPDDWLAAGHPPSGKVILVRGGRDAGNKSMDDAARKLDQSCGSISSRLRMRDQGYAWKQRFFPQWGEPQWRIEIREYDCDSTNSKQIYHIPPP